MRSAVRDGHRTGVFAVNASAGLSGCRAGSAGWLRGSAFVAQFADMRRCRPSIKIAFRRPPRLRLMVSAAVSSCHCGETMRSWSVDSRLPPRGTPVLRKRDRALAELRGAGGDRDGECAAHQRDARGIGAADRDRRGIAGHQFLTWRSRAGVRCDARKGNASVRGRLRHAVDNRGGPLPARRVSGRSCRLRGASRRRGGRAGCHPSAYIAFGAGISRRAVCPGGRSRRRGVVSGGGSRPTRIGRSPAARAPDLPYRCAKTRRSSE